MPKATKPPTAKAVVLRTIAEETQRLKKLPNEAFEKAFKTPASSTNPDLTDSINEQFGQLEDPLFKAKTWVSILEKVVESMANLPRFSKRDLNVLCEEFICVSEPLKEAIDAMDDIYHGRTGGAGMSDWLREAIQARRDELLQKLESASEKTEIEEDIAACDRLLERVRRRRELPPRAPTEQERKAVDAMAIFDRLPSA